MRKALEASHSRVRTIGKFFAASRVGLLISRCLKATTCSRKIARLIMSSNLVNPVVALFSGATHYGESKAVQGLIEQTVAALRLPGDFVRSGDRVVLKPNWVKEHDERFPGPNRWEHVV